MAQKSSQAAGHISPTLGYTLGAYILLALVAAWPLRAGLLDGEIVGAGPDVVSTLWGMWWFQQQGWSGLLGGKSLLLNAPYGAHGSVLSPSSAGCWAVLEPWIGIGRAAAWSAWIQVMAICLGCYVLARQAGAEGYAWVAAFTPLVARYLIFGIGEGSIVAVAAAPLPFGLYALIELARGNQKIWLIPLTAWCMMWMAMENPYLAPVLPAVAGFFWVFRGAEGGRNRIVMATAMGTAGILTVAWLFGRGANPDYPREVANQLVHILGRAWLIVDLPWARMQWFEAGWPTTLQWTVDATSATSAQGGRYMGAVVLLLGAAGALVHRAAKWWFLFALGGGLLALGSLHGNVAFPFIFLNALMDAVARPLTQPTRFLILLLVGCAVASACAMHWLGTRYCKVKWGVLVLLGMDAWVYGGLSLQPPNTALPIMACSQQPDGPTLIWPWDAIDGEKSKSQLYQMLHEQPAAHTGIASWALAERRVEEQLRSAGFNHKSPQLNHQQLYRLGYRWIIVEKSDAGAEGVRFGGLVEDCGDHALYQIVAGHAP